MKSSSNPIKRLAGETAIYGLGTMIPRFLNYLLVPFYTIVVFNQAEYGNITLLYSWVALLLVLLTYGMETSFFRYINKTDNDHRKVFNTSMSSIITTSVLFLLLMILFNNQISKALNYNSNPEYIVFIGIIIAADAITSIPFAYLRYKNKAKRFSTIRILNVLITILFNILFLWIIPKIFGDNVANWPVYGNISKVAFVFIANMIGSTFTILLLLPEFANFQFKIEIALLKKMLKYGLPILIISLTGMVNEVADKILLSYLLPDKETAEAQLGIYGASYKLAIIMMLFIQMFRYAAEPFFFAESEKKDARQLYSRVLTIFVIFTWIIFLIVMLFLDLFKYFIGPAFWAGLAIVPIILIAKIFLGVFYNLSIWYKLTNRTLYGAAIAVFGSIITIGLNFLWIPKYGYMGAAWANFACYFIIMSISFVWGRQVYKVDYQYKSLLGYSLLALMLYFISIYIPTDINHLRYLINGLLIITYIALVFWNERKNTIVNTSV